MDVYQKMYALLFNCITDAIECLDKGHTDQAKDILIDAQCRAEGLFIERGGKTGETA